MNQWTQNKHDSPHLFSIAVIYKVSLPVCDYLSLEKYNKLEKCKINDIVLWELYMPCAKGPRHTDIRTENNNKK